MQKTEAAVALEPEVAKAPPAEPKAWGLFRAEGLYDPKFEASGHTLDTLKQWASILPQGPKPETWTQYGDNWEAPTVYILWTIKEITCLP